MITNRCPHGEDTPSVSFCGRCEEEEGVGLDADFDIATFHVPIYRGLKPED